MKTTSIEMLGKKMPVTLSLLMCLVMLVTLHPFSVYGEPDPMARPTRPKAFTSADELRRYLDLVKDYYSLSGKARYGKRAQILPFIENPWEVIRIPLASTGLLSLRQKQIEQLSQMERETQSEQQGLDQQEIKQFQRGEQGLPYLYKVMAKYYDELQ